MECLHNFSNVENILRPLTGISLTLSAIVLVIVSAVLIKPVSSGTFPGTNGKIVFSSNRDGNYEIYVINTDGSGLRRVTNHPERDDYPSWHPDGKKLVVVSERDGSHDLYLIDVPR